MNKEDKELLFQDLSARLTYGVKCNVWYGPKSPALNEKDKYTNDILETINPKKGNCTFHNAIGYDFGFFPIEHVKPYLRSMSSMTEKEEKELCKLSNCHLERIRCYNKKTNRCDLWIVKITNDCTPFGTFDVESKSSLVEQRHIISTIDWLNAHHFDYRGLIEKGLALEAPEGMYDF